MAKFRCGHVTNSSSSSFIIAFKPSFNKIFNQKVKQFLKHSTFDTDKATIFDKDELENCLLNFFGYRNLNDLVENDKTDDLISFNNYLDLSSKGYQIIEKDIDYNDNEILEELEELKCDNFIVFSYS